MKKFIFVLAISSLTLSCSKGTENYTCVCVTTGPNTSGRYETSTVLNEKSRKEAEKVCNTLEMNAPGQTTECSIK